MRYFVDTEFIDDGKTIDLISIGMVSEDGREYYAQSVEFDHRKASAWVKENVLLPLPMCPWAEPSKKGIPGLYRADKAYHRKYGQCVDQQRGYIHNCPWRTRNQIHAEIVSFLDPEKHGKPELWGYYSAYDHVVFAQLFGAMVDLPQGYPMLTYDLRQWLDMHRMHDVCQPDDAPHNALEDARWIAKTYKREINMSKLTLQADFQQGGQSID